MSTVEERLDTLEAEVARLRTAVEGKRYGVIGRTKPDFLQNYVGKSMDSPLFDEVMHRIAEEREQERRKAEHEAE